MQHDNTVSYESDPRIQRNLGYYGGTSRGRASRLGWLLLSKFDVNLGIF